jgi:hypothetical protein
MFQLWPFGIAFVAGCIALIYMVPMGVPNAIKSVLGSVSLGGSLSQLCAVPALHFVGSFNVGLNEWAKEPEAKWLMVAILAIVIGLFAQSVIPQALKRAGIEVEGNK